MDLISSKDVMNIIRKSLNLIDERLISHGDRVGYIILKMLQYDKKYSEREIQNFVIASIFHDIGAYKGDEIDKMVQFETETFGRHSIYGYLFFKYLSPFSEELAQIILYHHANYKDLKKSEPLYMDIANFINLADRIDVMTNVAGYPLNLKYFKKYADIKYSSYTIELFEKANEEYKIMERIKDNSYMDELYASFDGIHFSMEEKEKVLEMMIYSIDFRSEHTVRHTIMTVGIADEIGKRMNLSEEDRRCLHFGALLHDIGKITTPLHILEAPGKLLPEEMEIMRDHVLMSEYILKDYINSKILEIAIRHHEKIDGTGYPKQLTGDDLTLPERILAVSDIVSALAGKRSYKEAFGKDKIRFILLNDRDKNKLCSEVVNCVVEQLNEIMDCVEEVIKEDLETYAQLKEQFHKLMIKYKAS